MIDIYIHNNDGIIWEKYDIIIINYTVLSHNK